MVTVPNTVAGLVLWLDADDTTTITDTGSDNDLDRWSDKSGLGNDAAQASATRQPLIVGAGINGRTAIGFDGSADRLEIADHASLNTGGPYAAKTLMMAFRTGGDVSSRQVLFEQGGVVRGLNFYIDNGEIYLNGWNLAETVWGPSFAKTAVTANTTYVATFVHDQAAGTVEGFLNGSAIGLVAGVSFLNNHGADIGLGAAAHDTVFHDGPFSGDGRFFAGLIGEFVEYNRALTGAERTGIEAYMQARWQGVATVAPVAEDDSAATAEDTPVSIAVLANDSDADGGTLSVQAVGTSGTAGTVSINSGAVDYNPNGAFNSLGDGETATDRFTYTLSDGQGGTDTATVTVTINGVDGTPPAAPNTVAGLVLWLDADDTTTITDTGSDNDLDRWADQSGLGNDAVQASATRQPLIVGAGINGRTAIGFDGTTDRLDIADHASLNTGGPYAAKTLMMAFRTGGDVTGRQVLFEQGGVVRGLNFYIDNGEIYLNGWNLAETVWGPSFAKTAITANTTYVATFVHDQAAGTVEGFLNASAIGLVAGVSFLNNHGADIGLGAVNDDTVFHDGAFSGDGRFFAGLIGEFVEYDRALTSAERTGLEAYMQARWTDTTNLAPVANDDSATTGPNQAETIAVLDNDSDANGGDVLTVTNASGANNGSLSILANTKVVYTPNAGFTGTDTFTYTIDDGHGETDTATVTVTITSGTPPAAPNTLAGLVLWLDAADTATITDTGSDNDLDRWADKSGQGNDAVQASATRQPLIVGAGINGRTAIGFDGTADRLDIADHASLNTGGSYAAKTLMMTFQTGGDVTSRQVLYEQGGEVRGLNFYIDNGEIYLNGWNLAETVWGPSFAKTAITANTTYVATFVHDQAAGTVEGFLNASAIGLVAGVSFLNSHSDDIGLGAVGQDTVFHDGPFTGDGHFFAGLIGEFVEYNRALTGAERTGLEAYMQARWTDTTNLAPVANDDSATTGLNQAKIISVLDNDSDANGFDVLTVTDASGANNGTLSILSNTKVTYTPNAGFIGNDTFTYTIDDGHGETDTATVTVSVSATDLPDQFNGLSLWLDAADSSTVTAAGGGVSVWQDKSGNGRDYSQADPARQPTANAPLLNGLPGIQSDGVNDYLEADFSGFSLGGVTLFMVAKVDQSDANSGIFNFYDDTAQHDTQDEDAFALRSDGDAGGVSLSRRLDGGNPLDLAGLDVGSQPAILVAALAAATGKMEVNGGTDVVDSYGDTDPIDPTGGSLGARWINGAISSSEFGANDYYEILVYDRLLTNAEINDVNDYLSGKWGITTTQSDIDFAFVPFAGQSNAAGHFSTSSGQGINKFLADLSGFTAADSVTSLNTASGGSAVDRRAVQTSNPSKYWWDLDADQPGPLLTAAVADIKAQGVTPAGIVWAQGERDARSLAGQVGDPPTNIERYKQATEAVFDYFRSELDIPDLPIYIQQIGANTDTARHAAHHLIREAQSEMAVALSDVHIAALSYDQNLADSVHFTGAGYAVLGSRLARYIAEEQGEAGVAYGAGPTILSAQSENGSREVIVSLHHVGGTNFSPATAIDGFLVEDSTGTVTIDAVVRQSATEIKLTLAAALNTTGTPQLGYINGLAAWDNSDIVTDNAAPLALPLAPDSVDIWLV